MHTWYYTYYSSQLTLATTTTTHPVILVAIIIVVRVLYMALESRICLLVSCISISDSWSFQIQAHPEWCEIRQNQGQGRDYRTYRSRAFDRAVSGRWSRRDSGSRQRSFGKKNWNHACDAPDLCSTFKERERCSEAMIHAVDMNRVQKILIIGLKERFCKAEWTKSIICYHIWSCQILIPFKL